MARAIAAPNLDDGDTITADCGCVATILALRVKGDNPTVTAKVLVPCTSGHPVPGGVERVGVGVIIHRDPKTVTKTTEVAVS